MKPFKRGTDDGGGDEGDRGGAFAGAPGDYLIAMTWFVRRTAKSGAEYLRARYVIAAGPHKGEGFYVAVSIDTDKPGSRRRLELWMEAVGCDEEIDLDSDAALAAAFKGRAFKATLTRKESRGEDGRVWINYDIDRIVYLRLYTERDKAAVAEWEQEWGANWKRQHPADAPGGGARPAPDGEYEEPAFSRGGLDDDIPF